MKLAIHQPEFLPWLGFFNKMARSDLFVILDHVQFKKRYFENRNRLSSPSGEVGFVCVPVKSKGRYLQTISQVEIDNAQKWKEKMVRTIYHWYRKAPFFGDFFGDLERILRMPHQQLRDLNVELILFLKNALGIQTELVFSSQQNFEESAGSDLILQICRKNNANVYLCGPSGRDYLNQADFEKFGISIVWLDYRCPEYNQMTPQFVPNLSVLDLLFNNGKASLGLLLKGIDFQIGAPKCSFLA